MTPTDENQSPSTHPNLMSPGPRRSGAEDDILDMLERDDASRRRANGRRRLMWSAGVLGLLLMGALVWLLNENANTAELRNVYQPAAVPDPKPITSAPMRANDDLLADTADGERPAATLDTHAPAGPHASASAAPAALEQPPQLVLLKPSGTAAKPIAKPVAKPAAKPAASDEPPLPRKQHASKAPQARKAAPPAMAKASAKRNARTQKTAQAKGPKKPAARAQAPARPKVAPGAAHASEEPADTDVALISAIISHAGDRAGGTAAEGCSGGGPKCARP